MVRPNTRQPEESDSEWAARLAVIKFMGGNPSHTLYVGPAVQRKAPDDTTKPGGDIAGQAQQSDLPHNAVHIDELEKGS